MRLALVKADEGLEEDSQWPGGAEQMYREAARPLTEEMLRKVRPLSKERGGVDIDALPPTVTVQDIWDFDGSALMTAEAKAGPEGDVQAMIFPNTDARYVKDIGTVTEQFSKRKRVFLLVNPFWRGLDSWGLNILQPGAKGMAEKNIFTVGNGQSNDGFVTTYSLVSARLQTRPALRADDAQPPLRSEPPTPSAAQIPHPG